MKLLGIGKVYASKIMEVIGKFRDFPIDLQQLKKGDTHHPLIDNKLFVLTDLEDDKLGDFILDHDDKIVSKVDITTHFVISGNILLMIGKQLEPYKLGIKVYTTAEFLVKNTPNILKEYIIYTSCILMSQCTGVTQQNRRCKRLVHHGSQFCEQHLNQVGYGLEQKSVRNLLRLEGPTIFSYIHIPALDQSFVFLGESHDKITRCTAKQKNTYYVTYWLEEIIKLSHHCIDLFVEEPFFRYETTDLPVRFNPLGKFQSPLDLITRIFATCRGRLKPCYDGKIRYHYSDSRQFTLKTSNEFYQTLPSDLATQCHSLECFTPEIYNISNYRTMLHYSVGLDRSPEASRTYTQFFDQVALKYHLTWKSNIYQCIVLNMVIKFITKEINKLNPLLDKQHFLEILCETTIETFDQTYLGLLTIQQDAYLLARLFMVFDKEKMQRGPAYCRDQISQKITHAIIYTGEAHTMVYLNFIKKYFGIAPEFFAQVAASDTCLTLSQPFDFFKDRGID